MINIVLIMPEYPGNVGNISRTCVQTNSTLHLVRPFKFDFSDKALRKAGIDYWEDVKLVIHDSLEEFLDFIRDKNFYLAETGGSKNHTQATYQNGDYIIFGREKEGIDEQILNLYRDRIITIPMTNKIDRSLNLANSVSIILYEALRQLDFNFN